MMGRFLALCVAVISFSTLVHSEETDPCSELMCEFPATCVICNVTGNAKCVPDCKNKNGGCAADQICEVVASDCILVDGEPCEPHMRIQCSDAPYVECGSDAFLACDSEFVYCLQQNKTRRADCIASCFSHNGGCNDDEICTTASEEDDESVVAGMIKCSNPNEFSSGCPAGQKINPCGNICQQTCVDILSGEQFVCIEICGPAACVCPPGLVVFRDRCVDPRLCYILDKYPPAIDPLPLQDNQLLYSFSSSSPSTDFMKDQFVTAVQVLLANSGFVEVKVNLHGIHQDLNLQIVVQLTGDDVHGDSPTQFSELFKDNSNQLPLTIIDVTPVTPRNADTECNSWATFILLVSASITCLVTILVFLIVMGVFIVLVFKSRAARRNKLKMDVKGDDNIYIISEEKAKLEFST